MGGKKRKHPDVEEILARPWCYYCERDFEDLKLLISHQKAKHFKCDRCGKRLNTAGGLSVHMNQVHKENLSNVENALPNRQGLDIEIFGMEGIPDDIIQQHNQRIIQNFYTAQAERHAATGNPPPGQQGTVKKIKVESGEELKKRLAEHKARLAAQKAGGANGTATNGQADGQSPAQGIPPSQAGFSYPPQGVPGAPPQQYPPTYPPGSAPAGSFNLPGRPPSNVPPTSNLPQRPPYGGAPFYNGNPPATDEGSARPTGDDIDQLIRMAEAGIKPPAQAQQQKVPEAEPSAEKKGKKDKEKNMRMVYGDTEVSPEEKMAMLPRYAYVPVA